MKTSVIVLSIAALACTPAFAKGGGHSGGSHSSSSHSSGSGSHSIKGYTKKDGTYVAPSHAKDPNNSKSDNWSAKGNVNPYTGKEGTKDPYTGK
ncbi:MAG: hypothetical protein RKO68_13560 [Candidatus Accumulibacter sp.]|nr:hypothetical protein [Accumulibacter sp.]